MPLPGHAAMLLAFDIAPDAIREHDDWHTHEHLPERLSIPGFLRGSRWTAITGEPRYIVLYEVQDLDTLTSPAYLARLNAPTPWTSKMMQSYRRMTRGLCSVVASHGDCIGGTALVARCGRSGAAATDAAGWLDAVPWPALAAQPGLCSVHVLRGAAAAEMTSEQRIRGADAGVDWAIVISGYDEAAVAGLLESSFAPQELERRGATDVRTGIYRLGCVLTAKALHRG